MYLPTLRYVRKTKNRDAGKVTKSYPFVIVILLYP